MSSQEVKLNELGKSVLGIRTALDGLLAQVKDAERALEGFYDRDSCYDIETTTMEDAQCGFVLAPKPAFNRSDINLLESYGMRNQLSTNDETERTSECAKDGNK